MSKLDEAFDLLPLSDDEIETPSELVVEASEHAEDADFDYTRKNQIDLIETSKKAVTTAMRIATESEQPRAIETLSMILKTASEMNRQLVQMSKDKAEVKATRVGAGIVPNSTTNNTIVFTGTMKEALAQLKKDY